MFLADGAFWQVGLMSEEGAWMPSVPDSAASSLPAQRRWGQRIPVPVQPCLAVGTIPINNNKKKAASVDFDVRLGQGSNLNLEQHLRGWGRLSITWYPWMAFLERTWKLSRSCRATSGADFCNVIVAGSVLGPA